MIGIYFVVLILACVNGRVPESLENLPDTSGNVLDSEDIKLEINIHKFAAKEPTAAQSNTDRKVDIDKPLHKHGDNTVNEFDKERTSQATIDNNEDINVSETSILTETTAHVPANKNIGLNATEENVSSTILSEKNEINNEIVSKSRNTDNVTLSAMNAKQNNVSNIKEEFNNKIQDLVSINEILDESKAISEKITKDNVTSTVLPEKNTIDTSIKPQPEKNYKLPTILNTTINKRHNKVLRLTSFIQKGLFEQARNASEVNSTLFLGFKSYSGFVTVNKTYNSNTFFWYFPVEGKPVAETPWIIWLQGGPGTSSLYALFEEIGPFSADKEGVLHKNPFSWLQNHSLVFIDNPIGVGYSFTAHEKGLATNMETYSAHLYEATRQLLVLFPELQRAPLYVAGESYGGKYVPSLALELHRHRDEIQVNLQGIMLGNALTEPYLRVSAEPWLYFGLLDADEVRTIQPVIDAYDRYAAAGNYVEALKKWDNNISEYLMTHSHRKNIYNYLDDEIPTSNTTVDFLSQSHVREAIHVGQMKYRFLNGKIYKALAPEPSDVKPKIETLLEHYKVLAYCGNLDQMMPCMTAAENHRSWNWSGASEFVGAPRDVFVFDSNVAGYYKTGGRFTEAVFIGAGHMVPADKPGVAQDFITKWTHGESLHSKKWAKVNYRLSNSCEIRVADNETVDVPNDTENQTTEIITKVTTSTESEINNEIEGNYESQVYRSDNKGSGNVTEITRVMDMKTLNNKVVTSKINHASELPTSTEFSSTEAEIKNNISEHEKETSQEGEPLILTPYLKAGLLEQARNASEVNATLFLGFKSYSGFFTVNETYNSNTFFWYFPVVGKPVEETPWIIWLQGGPGMTSVLGLLNEVGPFSASQRGKLTKNPNSWLQNHSLVFIDNPVGTGFSYTEHKDGFAADMETYSAHLYEATRQLLVLFPELQRAPLYVAGESYGGKYVPSLALELHRHKDEIQVNLQGVMVGNGYIAPALVANFSRSFYYLGLLSPEDLRDLQPQEACFDRALRDNDISKAKDIWIDILMNIIGRTQLRQCYNFLQSKSLVEYIIANCTNVMGRSDVRQALHVGAVRNNVYNETVTIQLKPEFLTSVKWKYEELMEHYRVLLYCGQLDQMMSCGIATRYHRTFEWSGLGDFVKAKKMGFTFNNTLAGYHKTGGNLTESLILGAGHMAPADQAGPVQDLVTRWTHQLEPFSPTQR